MKRYNCTLSDKRGAFGLCMEEHKEGAFVPFSEVSGLADTVMKMGGRCQLLADLLREVTKIVPAIGVATDDLPAVDAFLDRIEAALAGQVLERIGCNALAMMMDELHDICVGLDAPGGAQNGAEAWELVKVARDRVQVSLHHDRHDTEWTDAATSPVAADYRELQAQHDQLQSKYKAAMDIVRDLVDLPYSTGGLIERLEVRERARDLLAGHEPDPAVQEGQRLIYIGEIEVSHKWWLNCKSEFFSPIDGADFSDWPDGINKLFRIAASPRQQGGEPCAIEPRSSSPD